MHIHLESKVLKDSLSIHLLLFGCGIGWCVGFVGGGACFNGDTVSVDPAVSELVNCIEVGILDSFFSGALLRIHACFARLAASAAVNLTASITCSSVRAGHFTNRATASATLPSLGEVALANFGMLLGFLWSVSRWLCCLTEIWANHARSEDKRTGWGGRASNFMVLKNHEVASYTIDYHISNER